MPRTSVMAMIIGCSVVGSIQLHGKTILHSSPTLLAEEKGKGDPIEIDKLPKVVVDAVQKELPGARLTKATKSADGNYVLSDVKVGKREYTVTVSPEGKILKREEDND